MLVLPPSDGRKPTRVLPAPSPGAASVTRVTILGRVCHGRPGPFFAFQALQTMRGKRSRQAIALPGPLGALPRNPLMRYAHYAGPGL